MCASVGSAHMGTCSSGSRRRLRWWYLNCVLMIEFDVLPSGQLGAQCLGGAHVVGCPSLPPPTCALIASAADMDTARRTTACCDRVYCAASDCSATTVLLANAATTLPAAGVAVSESVCCEDRAGMCTSNAASGDCGNLLGAAQVSAAPERRVLTAEAHFPLANCGETACYRAA